MIFVIGSFDWTCDLPREWRGLDRKCIHCNKMTYNGVALSYCGEQTPHVLCHSCAREHENVND